MHPILNLGIGGCPGDPPASGDVNKSFDIDWVRVWQSAGPTQSNFVGGSGNQNWDAAANWDSGAPQFAGRAARFGNVSSGAGATLDWSNSNAVGNLVFRGEDSHTVGWGDDHLLIATGRSASPAIVQADPSVATQGTQTIGGRLELHENTRVRNATANALTSTGEVFGDGALTLESGKMRFTNGVHNRGGVGTFTQTGESVDVQPCSARTRAAAALTRSAAARLVSTISSYRSAAPASAPST